MAQGIDNITDSLVYICEKVWSNRTILNKGVYMNLNELLNKLKDRGLDSLIQSILVDHIEHIFSEEELESLVNELKSFDL